MYVQEHVSCVRSGLCVCIQINPPGSHPLHDIHTDIRVRVRDMHTNTRHTHTMHTNTHTHTHAHVHTQLHTSASESALHIHPTHLLYSPALLILLLYLLQFLHNLRKCGPILRLIEPAAFHEVMHLNRAPSGAVHAVPLFHQVSYLII